MSVMLLARARENLRMRLARLSEIIGGLLSGPAKSCDSVDLKTATSYVELSVCEFELKHVSAWHANILRKLPLSLS